MSWMDPGDGDYQRGVWLRAESARKAAEQARQQVADRTALAELPRWMRAVASGDVAAIEHVADVVTRASGFKIQCISDAEMDALGCGGYFVWPRGPIVVGTTRSKRWLGTVLHENGHGLAGACTEQPPHRRNHDVRAWWHCLECERAAWSAAMDLVPFDRAMFAHLQSSLGSYRSSTPAPADVIHAADRLTGSLAWAEHRQQHFRRQWRLERQARVASLQQEKSR